MLDAPHTVCWILILVLGNCNTEWSGTF